MSAHFVLLCRVYLRSCQLTSFLALHPHTVYFRIEPLDLGKTRALPPPIITVNRKGLTEPEYQVRSDITAIVDVNDAISFVNQFKDRDAKQTQVLYPTQKPFAARVVIVLDLDADGQVKTCTEY